MFDSKVASYRSRIRKHQRVPDLQLLAIPLTICATFKDAIKAPFNAESFWTGLAEALNNKMDSATAGSNLTCPLGNQSSAQGGNRQGFESSWSCTRTVRQPSSIQKLFNMFCRTNCIPCALQRCYLRLGDAKRGTRFIYIWKGLLTQVQAGDGCVDSRLGY